MTEGFEGSTTTGRKLEFGDRVRHAKRLEWGIGTVVRAEEVTSAGRLSQRVTVRFPNGGLKTLNTTHAQLEIVDGQAQTDITHDAPTVADLDRMSQSGWLSPVAERKINEIMTSLPLDVRDPFNSLKKRLSLALGLYRYERSGRGLIDWAIAQTGLDDPLTRFNRHELEVHFDRWAAERDELLARLLQEARGEPSVLNGIIDSAPPAGRKAVQKIIALR